MRIEAGEETNKKMYVANLPPHVSLLNPIHPCSRFVRLTQVRIDGAYIGTNSHTVLNLCFYRQSYAELSFAIFIFLCFSPNACPMPDTLTRSL